MFPLVTRLTHLQIKGMFLAQCAGALPCVEKNMSVTTVQLLSPILFRLCGRVTKRYTIKWNTVKPSTLSGRSLTMTSPRACTLF